MQILADANNSRDRNALRNWMYPKQSTLKCVWGPRLVSPPFRIKRREREMDFFWFSRTHLFFIHSRERVDFRARDSSPLRSRAIRSSSRESRRECSFINKEERGERKREHWGIVVVGARASPLHSARRQTRAECARSAYFHQFHVSRSTARSYFIDDLSARKRARKRD